MTTNLKSSRDRKRAPRGATCIDLLVGICCTALLLAIALPLLGAVSSQSGEARSLSNLRILASANAAYSATFDGRQYTAIPEDAGLVNGNCSAYLSSIACPPQLILGNAPNGAEWGYYLGSSGLCAPFGYSGSCANWVTYKPFNFSGSDANWGSFRVPNARAFNTFVDGRFYSDTFFAPNDVNSMTTSAVYRDAGIDFNSTSNDIGLSSYCFSPAAMCNPLTLAASGFKHPNTFAEGYVSPAVSQCTYPDLKTRMIEHNWNHRPPSNSNPAFAAGQEPWYFNAGPSASTQAIFFDGHVARVRTGDAITDDETAAASSGMGLWHRGTPLGATGYFGAQSFESPNNSHTILTIDGILGRDVLTPQ